MNDSTIIDGGVFLAVFAPNESPATWFGFLVKQDGLWAEATDEHLLSLLTVAESLEVTRHPTGNLSEPALRFPCVLGELKVFMDWCGYGELDDADLADLEAFTTGRHLATHGTFGVADLPNAGAINSELPALRAQEQAIHAALVELGHDPQALPENLPGKPGVRAACREALSKSPLFDGSTTFKKAWERMADQKDIKYSE